jgi:phosphatidylethanolamine-binding protein (PEBP) family uncharacterized protein
MATKTQTLNVRSLAFSQGGHIPKKYSCEGENINPPLEISNIPDEAQTLALIVEDPDAPSGIFYHWLVWNIPPNEPITEGYIPGIMGKNSFGKQVMGVLVRLKARIVISLNFMLSMQNWICRLMQLKTHWSKR